jgi:hypothetical protein
MSPLLSFRAGPIIYGYLIIPSLSHFSPAGPLLKLLCTCIHIIINELSWLNMVKPCSVLPISAKKSGLLLQQHWTPRRLGFRAKRCNSSLRPATRRWRQQLYPSHHPHGFLGKNQSWSQFHHGSGWRGWLETKLFLSIAESLTHQSRLDVYPLTKHWLCQWKVTWQPLWWPKKNYPNTVIRSEQTRQRLGKNWGHEFKIVFFDLWKMRIDPSHSCVYLQF